MIRDLLLFFDSISISFIHSPTLLYFGNLIHVRNTFLHSFSNSFSTFNFILIFAFSSSNNFNSFSLSFNSSSFSSFSSSSSFPLLFSLLLSLTLSLSLSLLLIILSILFSISFKLSSYSDLILFLSDFDTIIGSVFFVFTLFITHTLKF